MFTKQFWKDMAERVGTTAILAGIGVALVYTDQLDPAVAVAVVTILNVIKTVIAEKFGTPETGGFVTVKVGEKPAVELSATSNPPETDTRTAEDLAERAEFEERDDVDLFEGQADVDEEGV